MYIGRISQEVEKLVQQFKTKSDREARVHADPFAKIWQMQGSGIRLYMPLDNI